MPEESLFILAVLAGNVALSEWLVRHTAMKHLGSALLVILLTALMANVGLIPTFSADVPVYTGIFDFVAPIGIFWLLLRVSLADLRRAGFAMVALFLLGSAGTVVGVLAGLAAVGGSEAFGELAFAISGMFVGTYTGGSINFNAIALEYRVMDNGVLYAGATAVDSAMTTVWMAVTVALPRALAKRWPGNRAVGASSDLGAALTGEEEDTEALNPMDICIMLGLGAGAVWFSGALATWLKASIGYSLPKILVVSTLALGLAQIEQVRRLRGSRALGMLAVLLFLAVIGALCDLSALRELGQLGRDLVVFVVVVVLVHGTVVFGGAALFRCDIAMAAVASQANIGGGTSALALARSLGRADLILPAILIGALGTALGTYLGFGVAEAMR